MSIAIHGVAELRFLLPTGRADRSGLPKLSKDLSIEHHEGDRWVAVGEGVADAFEVADDDLGAVTHEPGDRVLVVGRPPSGQQKPDPSGREGRRAAILMR
jgi:hypothetical protein